MIPTIPPALPPPSETLGGELEFASATEPRLWRFHDEYVLGTRLKVVVNTHSGLLARKAAVAARSEIARLDLVFNHRRGDSEIAQLNQSRLATASVDLFEVIHRSEAWRGITRGAFDGRMGKLFRLWSDARKPDRRSIEGTLADLHDAKVTLDPTDRHIGLSLSVELSLDAVAKGYIVDSALNAARRAAPGIAGVAVEIGGDIRCWGESTDCHEPDRRGWRIGIPDASKAAENAPLVDGVLLENSAIATSGRGPRDCLLDRYRSTTISPYTGRPISKVLSASVVASHAADADAIATACLVLPPTQSLALVNQLEGVAARITDARGEVHQSNGWPAIQLAATSPDKVIPAINTKPPSLPANVRWPADWELGMVYEAPDRKQSERNADFRTPYMALWITDAQNRRVRTIVMVGTDLQWQRDNFIWWTSNRERAAELVDLRSQATALSGRYAIYWNGIDDDWQPVPLGTYTLHLETSQERGKHSYRSMTIELGRERLKLQLPNLPDSGGIAISYGHYNDRFNSRE